MAHCSGCGKEVYSYTAAQGGKWCESCNAKRIAAGRPSTGAHNIGGGRREITGRGINFSDIMAGDARKRKHTRRSIWEI